MTLTSDELQLLESWWRAANYLTVGQIYLQANPLLREPLQPGHIKPRLLGHWGTSPGINLVWAHLNRLIVQRDQKALLLIGPGHGGPAANANAWRSAIPTTKTVAFECPQCHGQWQARLVGDDVKPLPLQEVAAISA